MITPGTEVRFRRRDRGRWHTGVLTGPADGGAAVWVRDTGNGASRCLRLDRVELAAPNPNGRLVWRSIADMTHRPLQRSLL
jgi:hypothetical protein